MNVSLLSPTLVGTEAIGEAIVKMARFYRDRGDQVRIFIEAPPRGVSDDIVRSCRVVTLGTMLRAETAPADREGLFFSLSDLTVYHYPGYYELLETIHGRDRGAVLFAYHGVMAPGQASSEAERERARRDLDETAHVRDADLAMALSAAVAAQLRTHQALPEERVRVVSFDGEQLAERLEHLTRELMTHVARASELLTANGEVTPPWVKRVAVYETGAESVRATREARGLRWDIACFVDEDERKQGRTFLGRPVIGLASLQSQGVEELIVSGDRMEDVRAQLRRAGLAALPLRTNGPATRDTRLLSVRRYAQAMRAALARAAAGRAKVVIFGAGAAGQKVFALVTRHNDVVAFADNDPQKHGTSVLGRPVIGVPDLAGMDYDRVIVASIHAAEIKKQLFGVGIAPERIDEFAGR